MTFGQRLCALREERGWSQDLLAEKTEVSRQTVSNWENDKVQIDAEKLKRLAEVFGVSMDELYAFAPPAERKRERRFPLVLAIVLIALALLSVVFSVIGLCASDLNETSSAVTVSGVAGLCIALGISVAVIVAGVLILVKTLKKK